MPKSHSDTAPPTGHREKIKAPRQPVGDLLQSLNASAVSFPPSVPFSVPSYRLKATY